MDRRQDEDVNFNVEQTVRDGRSGVRVGLGLALLATVLALTPLAGYGFGVEELVRMRASWQAMSISTALLCLCLAGALAADSLDRLRLTRAIGFVVLIFSGAILCGLLVTGHDVISLGLMRVLHGMPPDGETSLATGFCTGLLAIGCLGRPRSQPAGVLAIAVMLISALAVMGYAYGVKELYDLLPFHTMSMWSALGLFTLSAGFLLSNQENGVSALLLDRSVTGGTTRRQLSFLLLLPFAAYALLRLTAVDHLGAGAAMALLVVLTIGPLAALIFRDAKMLTRVDNERREKLRVNRAKLTVERRYRTLFNELEAGFCVIEMKFDASGHAVDYRFLEINPAFAGQTGLTDAEGKWMRDLAPAQEQHWFDLYGRVAMTGQSAKVEFEAAALGRHFEVSAFRVDDPHAHHVAILFSDVSDRKRAELDMRAMNETLEKRVAERAAELEQTQDALRQAQKLEAIGQLTGGVAHDFNNLLTVIQGSADLLKRPNLTEERRIRFTDAIIETAARATKLTGQLLAFARRQSLRPETFDIGDSLNELKPILSSLTGGGITLRMNLPTLACYVHADRSQFDTAIVNMTVNAKDAMAGGGSLTITAGAVSGIPALRLHPPVPGDYMAVTIQDSGSGISADDLGRIFEPFFHDQGCRRRDRPWPVPGDRLRQAIGRRRACRQPARPGRNLYPLSAS